MHVTYWTTAQKGDPKLDAVLQWLESKKKIDLRTLLEEYALSKEGVHGWNPFIVVQEHMASLVHWSYWWTVSLLPPPLWMPKLIGDLPILGTCHNSEPQKCLLYKLGDRPCHCRVPEHPPRFLGC